jgi:16S rRNA (cytidine1402-2'-O)-methyltransferase
MNNTSTTKGTVFIVATPIGNLTDISAHAIEVLQQVQWIAAEDTRHSAILLNHYGIQTPLKSLHEHNELQRIQYIEETLNAGHDIALISDAGTPLISDPGYQLVTHLVQAGFRISPVPGCCALIAALSCSGLATDQFLFLGFLPNKSTARKTVLSKRLHETATQIFYEAPHRLLECLLDMACIYGDTRQAVVARELSKTYENFQHGSLPALHDYYQAHPEQQRGEIVILVAGSKEAATPLIEAERILKILLDVLPIKTAAAVTADITQLRKNELYQMALRIKS